MMVAGLPYAFGNIIPYIVSYYRMYLKYNVNYDTFFPMNTMTEIISSLIYPYANYLVSKRFHQSSRPPLLIGLISGVILLFLGVAFKVPPYLFIVMYALGTGLIKGFNKQSCLMAGWSHLAQKKGLVSGIILGGYGFGGSLYGLYYHNKIA